jgi:hypothetical protein
MLRAIHANSQPHGAGYRRRSIDMRAPETFTGIYSNAFSATEWLSATHYGRRTRPVCDPQSGHSLTRVCGA